MHKFLAALLIGLTGACSQAQSVIDGLTFTVLANDSPHSLAAGNALVGSSLDVVHKLGFAEFNLAGRQAASSVVLSFRETARYLNTAPNGPSVPQGPSGTLRLTHYGGDNLASLGDFFLGTGAAPEIASFLAQDYAVGDTLSFNVTALYNAAVARGDAAFGVRLSATGGTFNSNLWLESSVNFNAFQLQLAAPVPEPTMYALLLGGLGLVALMARRRGRRNRWA